MTTPGKPAEWPMEPFRKAFEEALTTRSGRNLAVLVYPGAFSPVHMGHLVMMDQATERLQRAGYDVLAGWLVPLAGCGHLSATFRLKALSELKSSLMVSEWAVRNEKTKEMEVVHALKETLLEETGASSKGSARVRVVAVCGADDMKRYSSLKPQDMLGLVVVPLPGDEEFLLEKPLQQLYIAEASQSKFSTLDGKVLEEAIAGGDMAFVSQALPPDVNRLALFPSVQEQQDFGFDLAKLETQVPTDGPWPAAKLMKKLVTLGPDAGDGAHTWAVLILSDAMAPAMKCHLEILAKARERLETRGYCVIGMWLSPWNESKLKGCELSKDFRTRAAKLMVSAEELAMVSTWEMEQEGKQSAAQIARNCRETLVRMYPNTFEGGQLCVFHASSSKNVPFKSSDQAFRDALGSVVIPCSTEDMLLEKPSQLSFVTEEIVDVDEREQFMRNALRTGNVPAAVEALGSAAARFVLAPSNGEREMQEDFQKLGVQPIGDTLLAKTRQNVKRTMDNLGLSGNLKSEELRRFLQKIDPTLTEQEVNQLLKASPKSERGMVPGAEFMDWILNSLKP